MVSDGRGFFDDPETWDYMSKEIIHGLLAAVASGAPIRVWNAGCSTGEDAYGVAILLREALGGEAFGHRVKIYATDGDGKALLRARRAVYGMAAVQNVSPERLARWFEACGEEYAVRRSLARALVIAAHDLTRDPPISRVDLLVCRTALADLPAPARDAVLRRFQYALAVHAVLVVGPRDLYAADPASTGWFTPIDRQRGVFRRNPDAAPPVDWSSTRAGDAAGVSGLGWLAEQTLLVSPVPVVVVDGAGQLALTSRAARVLLGLGQRDNGRRVADLDLPGWAAELLAHVERARRERRRHRFTAQQPGDGRVAQLEVHVMPLVAGQGEPAAVAAFIQDVSALHRLETDLGGADSQLATAYEELQSTNEELETTNEELMHTVAELETANVELLTANAELLWRQQGDAAGDE